jgi:hypothetical protein
MPVSRHFPQNYLEARDKFRAAVAHAKVPLTSFENPFALAPNGAALSTDVALFGPEDARNLLVLISGVHGVEGFAGSGCQVALIERVRLVALPVSTAVLVVHAMDPYGFAWQRRVNEHGVDLNCNAIDHAAPPEPLPLYEALHPWLMAGADFDSPLSAAANATLSSLIEQYGERAYVDALTAGQYRHADGLCYGGTQQEWSTRTFLDIMQRWGAGKRHIALIDIHASPSIPGEDGPIHPGHDAHEAARAWSWFGLRHASSRSFCTARCGSLVEAAASVTPWADRTPVQLHLDTVPWRQAIDAWRADQWLHQHGDPASHQAVAIKRALRDSFYVDTRAWQSRAVQRAEEVLSQALAGLSL